MSVLVKIPAPAASPSKMQKKGWKCWAKWLSKVKTPANDGYAYEGEFTEPGSSVEAEFGDVLLHLDQGNSADVGIVMRNSKDEAFFHWIASASSDGRKWCGPLAKPARAVLAMSTPERLAHVAQLLLAEHAASPKEHWTEKTVAHYTALAGLPQAVTVDPDALRAEREQLAARIAEIDAILSTVPS